MRKFSIWTEILDLFKRFIFLTHQELGWMIGLFVGTLVGFLIEIFVEIDFNPSWTISGTITSCPEFLRIILRILMFPLSIGFCANLCSNLGAGLDVFFKVLCSEKSVPLLLKKIYEKQKAKENENKIKSNNLKQACTIEQEKEMIEKKPQ